jgi:hypothetical protein
LALWAVTICSAVIIWRSPGTNGVGLWGAFMLHCNMTEV